MGLAQVDAAPAGASRSPFAVGGPPKIRMPPPRRLASDQNNQEIWRIMFGIGIIEIFVVLMVSLFVIGPDKLPEAARAVGRFFHSIKQYANEISIKPYPPKEKL